MYKIVGEDYSLFHADYRETFEVVKEGGGADLVATSPPYADARTYGMDVSFTDEDYQQLARELWEVLKPGGQALINIDAPVRDWNGRGSERGMHPWRFMLYASDVVGFRVPDRLAFGRLGIPGEYKGRFRNDWEPLIWLVKPGPAPYFDKWSVATKTNKSWVGKEVGARVGGGDLRVRVMSGRAVEEGVTHRGTLWDYGSCANKQTGALDLDVAGHPARWPYKLVRDLVLCFSAPGALVVDPFVGAGTTLVAAVEDGRRFIGGDLGKRKRDDKLWVDVASEIIRNRRGGDGPVSQGW